MIAEYLGGYQLAIDFVDHYRGGNEDFDYNWEERWIRDEGYFKIVPRAIAAALEKTGVDAATIDHFVMPCLIRRVPERLTKEAGIKAEAIRDQLHGNLGEAGSAHSLVMLVESCLITKKSGIDPTLRWPIYFLGLKRQVN